MWIRTTVYPYFYVHEIRGACYISWVSEKDKKEALSFPDYNIDSWVDMLRTWTGFDLISVEPEEYDES